MTVAITRTEHTAADLRRLASESDDAAVTRRLLAPALVLDRREDVARLAGMDRQALRDWVHRYNADGVAGLAGRHGGGVAPRLSVEQHERTVGKLLHRLRFSHISTRPRHPKAGLVAQASFRAGLAPL